MGPIGGTSCARCWVRMARPALLCRVDLHQHASAAAAYDGPMTSPNTPTHFNTSFNPTPALSAPPDALRIARESPDFLAVFKSRLLDERKQLLQRIADERGGLVSRADLAAEHFDNSIQSRAQIQTERETEFALNEQETAELVAIDAALERLQVGTYGLCTDCGVAILPARLQVYPTAKRCIDCQSAAEQHR